MLKDLQARIQGHVSEEDVETLEIDLPLFTLEQLDEAEIHLADAEAQRRMVKLFIKWETRILHIGHYYYYYIVMGFYVVQYIFIKYSQQTVCCIIGRGYRFDNIC